MTIAFSVFYRRITETTDIATQIGLADALGVNRSAITQAKVRNAVPAKWVLALARKYHLSPDWLEFGTGSPRPAVKKAPGAAAEAVAESRPAVAAGPELVFVPKVNARLCAGGGSFEVEAVPVSEHPFPYQWLSRMGSPASMVFMDVIGNSMEPGIRDGDMVLVDQSNKQISPHAVMAVAVEDAVYLKRVEKRQNGILLHSDNPEYSDMELYGDELDMFGIIGKIVWLCRDCRYT